MQTPQKIRQHISAKRFRFNVSICVANYHCENKYAIWCCQTHCKRFICVAVLLKGCDAKVLQKVKKRDFDNLSRRVKRIEDVLELSDAVTSFKWKDFSERDKKILMSLYKSNSPLSTTEIATDIMIDNPETSGRSIVYRRLKRIERISRRMKGNPLVLYDKKSWSLNYDVFNFRISETND